MTVLTLLNAPLVSLATYMCTFETRLAITQQNLDTFKQLFLHGVI